MHKVNWANPITRNMFFCVAAGSLNNLINRHGVQFSQLTTGGSAIEYLPLEEAHRFFSSGNYYATSADYGTVVGSNIRNANTQFIYFKPSIPSDHKAQPGELLGFSPADPGYLSWNSVNPGLRYGGHYGSSWYNSQASFTLAAHQWYAVAFRWDGDRISLWINGVKDGEIDTQNSPSPDLTYVTKMAGGSFGGYFAGDIAVACQWDRALTDTELTRLAADPFQVLEQRPIIGAHQLPTHVDYATVKVPWTSQPPAGTPIDWTHPLAQGLMNFVVFEGGFARDYARDLMLSVNLSGSDYEMAHHKDFRTTIHRAADTDATHYGVINTDEAIEWIVEKQYSAMTQTCWVGVDNQATSWDRLISWATDEGSANHMGFFFESAGTGRASFMIHGAAWNTDTAFISPDNYFTKDGVIRPYSGVWNKDKDSGAMRFYQDGQYHSTSTQTQTTVSDTTNSSFRQQAIVFSNKADGTASTYTLSGELGAYMIHERDLSAAEIASLHANPWQIFKPREIMVPINEDLPELGTFDRDRTEMPWKPPS